MQYILLLVAVLCALTAVQSQESGIKFFFSDSGVNSVIRKYVPDYAAVIMATQIPAVHVTPKIALVGEVDFNVEDLKITKIDFGDLQAHCKSPNIVILGTNTASVSFALKWSYRQKNWPHASGHGEASGFAEKTKLMGSVFSSVKDGKFVFKAEKIVFDIGNSKVSIKGGFSGWIASLVEGMFRGIIRDSIESNVQKVIAEKIDVTLNELIQKANFIPEIKVGNETQSLRWITDFTIPDNQLFIDEKFLAVAPRFSSRSIKGQHPSSLKPVALPDQPTSLDRDVNAFITEYMLNSYFEALHYGDQLHYAVLPEMVPDFSPVKFNTSNFKLWFPTLYEKYPNAGVRMDVETLNAPVLTFSPQGIKFTANTSMMLSARGNDGNYQKAIKMVGLISANYNNVTAKSEKAGTLLIMGGKVEANVQLSLMESYIGEVNVTKFGQIINMVALRGGLNLLNKQLAAGYQVDLNTLVPGLFIDNLDFFLHDGYVNINTNATYVPKEIMIPKTNSNDAEVLRMLSFMMEEMQNMKNTILKLQGELDQCRSN